MKIILAAIVVFLASIAASQAQVKLSGYFIAKEECPAFQSFRKKSNPGNVFTKIDTAYQLLGKNSQTASYYLIVVDGQPLTRWVAATCGEHVVPVEESIVQDASSESLPDVIKKDLRYILAISWQPGFCETSPSKAECQSQTEKRFDATHFTLHGLWPQPSSNIYCNVSPEDIAKDKGNKWQELGELPLDIKTRQELNRVMPGTMSYLQRHEWIKHGSCYGDTPEEYFSDSLGLMQQINSNDSVFRNFFAENIGKEVTAEQIRTAFEDTFGDGTGSKIKITCKRDDNRLLITEITIGLQGDLDEVNLHDALLAAPDANDIGCSKGIVDPVGFQ